MFPSCGLFAGVSCPLVLCERPHCSYKHDAEAQDSLGPSSSFSSLSTGIHNCNPYPPCVALVNDENKDDSFHELERLNKEIESVRHEVEQEKRRLSCYQTVQADSRNYRAAGKPVDKGSSGLLSCTDSIKRQAQGKKYVIDKSKPRTDLEYDPLSNFSAALWSHNSLEKEQKMKNQQGLTRTPNAVACDQTASVTREARLSQSPSPEPLFDSNEDSVLIIDVPTLPDGTGAQARKPVDSLAGESSKDAVGGMEVKTAPDFFDPPLRDFANAETFKLTSASKEDANKVHNDCGAESQNPSTSKNNKCEDIVSDGNAVVTECLEDLQSECLKISGFQSTETGVEKVPEPASLPTKSDQKDHKWNDVRGELPRTHQKMNLLQPLRNLLCYKASAVDSQHAKQARTAEQPAQDRIHSHSSPDQSAPSLVPGSQKVPSKTSERVQSKGVISHTSSVRYLELEEEAASGSSHCQAQHISSSAIKHMTDRADSSSSEPSEQLLVRAKNEEIIIISSDEELNGSDFELSDSDPMEECYRIFMEANDEDKGKEAHPDMSIGTGDVVKPEINVTPHPQAGKKRVAHEAIHTLHPVAKIRPQPKVLVPLREPTASGFGSRPPIAPKIQQAQQRASMLTASVTGGQAFVSSNYKKKPEPQSVLSALTRTPDTLVLAPAQNAYLNSIPVGRTVIKMGSNLHLYFPEGAIALPAASSSSPVPSVLTPISEVPTSTVVASQAYCSLPVTPVQKSRPTPPVLIPALARKPSLTSAPASVCSSSAASTTPQPAAKQVPVKRKLKQQTEAAKVPHDVRQRYVNMFTEEFLKTTASVNEAFQKALAEERTVYGRSMNKVKYQSVAVNALKRLRNQSAIAKKRENEVKSQSSKGKIPLNSTKLRGNDDMAFYECLKDYILTDERLSEGNYPIQHPEKPGSAVLFSGNKKVNADPLKRICCRCGATYSVSQTGKHVRKEECIYHYGKGITKRVPGGVETRYSCCEGIMGAPGCQVFQLHVHDFFSLDGFVSTIPRPPSDTSCPGVYALDCERCYTTQGLELSRVTVINSNLQVVYDTFVRPDSEVIDYNTRFSGISEEHLNGSPTSLREVQETLLSFVSADTILIGHGFEKDLCLLKLIHGKVVDTSVVFPHRLGPPHKLALNKLTAEYLRKIIQESVCGHDTAEDAAACMELMLWKVKEDGKMKK